MIYIEIVLIIAIVIIQAFLYLQNRQKAIDLEGFYPDRHSLSVYKKPVPLPDGQPAYTVDQLGVKKVPGSFKAALEDTNSYLLNTKGGAASWTILQELSARPYQLAEVAAGAMVTTPLYVGLLGTFLGIGIGLLSIVRTGVSEAGIQLFLAGVMIAMVGSFCGLLFTVIGNYGYQQAKQQAAERQQAYLAFLQAQLMPRLQQDMASSFNNLRTVLDQFNQDFFQKIIDFKEVFSNLSEYIGVQEKFLTALEGGGYNQLTEANLRFLEQIRENASLFESFGGYQKKLNESLQLGAGAARDIREVVDRLHQIDDVQDYVRQNEEMLRKQVGYLTAHQDRMQDLAQTIQQHFFEAGDEIAKVVRERLQILKREEQDAGEELRAHFERLREENVYQKIAEQLQPIHILRQQMDELSQASQQSSQMLLETSEYLVKKINQDGRLHTHLLEEMQELNRQLAQLNEKRSWWQQLMGTKKQA